MKIVLCLLLLSSAGCQAFTDAAQNPDTKTTIREIVTGVTTNLSSALDAGAATATGIGTVTGNPILLLLGGLLAAGAVFTKKKEPPTVTVAKTGGPA